MPSGPVDRIVGIRVGVLIGAAAGAVLGLIVKTTGGTWLVVLLIGGAVIGGLLGALWARREP